MSFINLASDIARTCLAAQLLMLSCQVSAADSLVYSAGSHVVPAGVYSSVDALGTASVQIGDGVQANNIRVDSGSASIHVSGGQVLGGAFVQGAFKLTDGRVRGTVYGIGAATIEISGGRVGPNGNVVGSDQTVIHFSAGSVSQPVLYDQAVFNWHGGTMAPYFLMTEQTVWNIHGSAFLLGGVPFAAGETVTGANSVFTLFSANDDYNFVDLTVTLADDSRQSVRVLVSNGSNAVVPTWTGAIHLLPAVPEPGAWTLWLLGLAGLGLMAGRRSTAVNQQPRAC